MNTFMNSLQNTYNYKRTDFIKLWTKMVKKFFSLFILYKK